MSGRDRFPWLAGAAVALLLGLLTPWPGPHVDRYLPLAAVAFSAFDQGADAGFWLFCLALWIAGAAVWFGLATAAWWLWRRWAM